MTVNENKSINQYSGSCSVQSTRLRTRVAEDMGHDDGGRPRPVDGPYES